MSKLMNKLKEKMKGDGSSGIPPSLSTSPTLDLGRDVSRPE